MSRWTLGEVRDVSLDPRGGLERVGGLWGDPGRIGEPPGKSGTGRGTPGEVWNESGDPR